MSVYFIHKTSVARSFSVQKTHPYATKYLNVILNFRVMLQECRIGGIKMPRHGGVSWGRIEGNLIYLENKSIY